MRRQPDGRRGFSLVEVNLAILLAALGMLVLFALFPSALRENEAGLDDTAAGMFGDFVLSGLEANASSVTNWNQWADMTAFSNAVAGAQLVVPIDGSQIVGDGTIRGPVKYANRDVKYLLNIEGTRGSRARAATLWVRSGKYGPSTVSEFRASSRVFHSRFFFCGM